MDTCIFAVNQSQFSSCLTVFEIEHDNLQLTVAKGVGAGLGETILNGAFDNFACPDDPSSPGSCLTTAPVCDTDFPDDGRFLFRRIGQGPGWNPGDPPNAGTVIDVCTILESDKPALAPLTFVPGDDQFDTFFSEDGSGVVNLEFLATGRSLSDISATWDGGIETNARVNVSIEAVCDVEETPATSPLGVGAMLIGLSGLGAFLGFRRRRS
jgi:MYXO-CTERM domain-containing protein